MKEWTKEMLTEKLSDGSRHVLFLYTPICGTCQLAKKMLTVVEAAVPNLEIGMIDLNYYRDKAEEWQIQSVPCLLLLENGEPLEKIYAIKSVDYLYAIIKKFLKAA